MPPKSLCQKDRCSLMRIGESFLSPMLPDELDLTHSQARHIFKRVVNPSAWKGDSPKLDFRFASFSEVQLPLNGVLGSSA